MRAIFIADAHLRHEQDANYRLLLRFLREQRGSLDALYILGDLFEFWIGHRETTFPHHQAMLDEFRLLAADGVAIHYFEGNHDFHLRPYFSRISGARVYPGPARLELDGKTVYVCHGDQINDRDTGYRLLRFLLHNRLTGAVAPLLPARLIFGIADRMGRKSKRSHGRRNTKWDYQGMVRAFAACRFDEGCDAVVSGHFHIPLLEHPGPHGARTIVSLGDWIRHFSYAEWQDGTITLRTYQPPADHQP